MENVNDREEMDTTAAIGSETLDPAARSLTMGCEYQPRTLSPTAANSRRRRSLLPAYPMHKYDKRSSLLLLANVHTVDRKLLETLSYSGEKMDGNLQYYPFQLQRNANQAFLPSFMIEFYQVLYRDTSRRWKIPYSLIDYNLTRLQKCMTIYTKQVGEAALGLLAELPLALEFYLQIDVDLFFMKTCNFQDAQPRMIVGQQQEEKEGLLCSMEPCARYGIQPCRCRQCHLCRSEQTQFNKSSVIRVVDFTDQQIHRFVNGYEAILNCPAICDTSNIIYALTCPCGEYDYLGSTSKSFFERTEEHREEGHRIIREFLIGPENMQMILDREKRKKQSLANEYDQLLYHHSAICRHGLQRFLERNPIYWCFVPQKKEVVKRENEQYSASKKAKNSSIRPTTTTNPFEQEIDLTDKIATITEKEENRTMTASGKPLLFAPLLTDITRTKEETSKLVRHVPEPPAGYAFSIRQHEAQFDFFYERKEACVYSSHYIDLYNYAIIAVLPRDCTRQLRQFIESLFITHAETELNLIGRLTHKYPYVSFDPHFRGHWCSDLVHPNVNINRNDRV